MSEAHGKDLMIDSEFRDLIRPLLKEEYRMLEQNLINEGCKDPLVVWNGVIIDGHNRFEICMRLGIPFSVREHHFDNREEAVVWICTTQLLRKNISDEARKYLIGKRYEAEKAIFSRRTSNGMNQYRKREEADGLPYEVFDPNAPVEHIRTSQRIGDEYHLAHGTVEKYGTYSKAIDRIAKKEPSMLAKILSGRYKISHDNILALSHMSAPEVRKFGKSMKAMKKASPYLPYGVSRSQISRMTPQEAPPIQTAIKNMPEYDPDAEIAGLTLTIPSWANSINRTKTNADLTQISLKARMSLEHALFDLQATIEEFLRAIKE